MSVTAVAPRAGALTGHLHGHRCRPGPTLDICPLSLPSSLVRAVTLVRDGPAVGASLARFSAAGGTANLVYLVLFWLLAGAGTQTANAVGSIVSTVVANELHRRVTFHARATVRWQTAQLQGGGLAIAGLAATSVALAIVDTVLTDAGSGTHTVVIAAVTGLVGLLRFVLLRSWFTVPRAAALSS